MKYERRNKESKNIYKKHSNKRENICYSTLKRLTQAFKRYMNIDKYKDGSSKQKRKNQRDQKKQNEKEMKKKQKIDEAPNYAEM